MEKLEVDSKSGSDEEFFDCLGKLMNITKKLLLTILFDFFGTYYLKFCTFFNQPRVCFDFFE